MKVLLIDNYDSFTFNLGQLLKQSGQCTYDIVLNDQIPPELPGFYDKILISPGPGLPWESGGVCEIIRQYGASKSILGICLGHQAIAEVYGAQLIRMETPAHGQTVQIVVVVPPDPVFAGCPQVITATLYHSWTVQPESIPPALDVIASTKEGAVMGLRHQQYDLLGFQFHPESVATEYGAKLISNWLKM